RAAAHRAHRPRRRRHRRLPSGGDRPRAGAALPRAWPSHAAAGFAHRRRGCGAAAVTTGLVPTMGALHAGHRALLRAARGENDRVVMSLFVNPTQFAPGEDYDRYPRDEPRDREIAAGEGVDEIYAPTVEEMYPPGFATRVVCDLGAPLEGAARPGHFDGVATVVLKLLLRIAPDRVSFVQQFEHQLAVCSNLVRYV